jgi:hypothetical protein
MMLLLLLLRQLYLNFKLKHRKVEKLRQTRQREHRKNLNTWHTEGTTYSRWLLLHIRVEIVFLLVIVKLLHYKWITLKNFEIRSFFRNSVFKVENNQCFNYGLRNFETLIFLRILYVIIRSISNFKKGSFLIAKKQHLFLPINRPLE